MSTTNKFELRADVEDFLLMEAEILDSRNFTDWLGLLTEDVRYEMPLRLNVAADRIGEFESTRPGQDTCWFDEGIATLRSRVAQLQTHEHWAEEPLSRVTRIITNLRVEEVDLVSVEARSAISVYRNRVSDETDWLVGRRADRLVRHDGSWRIQHRRIWLDQNVLMAKNLTILL